jgi:hypothetical protein
LGNDCHWRHPAAFSHAAQVLRPLRIVCLRVGKVRGRWGKMGKVCGRCAEVCEEGVGKVCGQYVENV